MTTTRRKPDPSAVALVRKMGRLDGTLEKFNDTWSEKIIARLRRLWKLGGAR